MELPAPVDDDEAIWDNFFDSNEAPVTPQLPPADFGPELPEAFFSDAASDCEKIADFGPELPEAFFNDDDNGRKKEAVARGAKRKRHIRLPMRFSTMQCCRKNWQCCRKNCTKDLACEAISKINAELHSSDLKRSEQNQMLYNLVSESVPTSASLMWSGTHCWACRFHSDCQFD